MRRVFAVTGCLSVTPNRPFFFFSFDDFFDSRRRKETEHGNAYTVGEAGRYTPRDSLCIIFGSFLQKNLLGIRGSYKLRRGCNVPVVYYIAGSKPGQCNGPPPSLRLPTLLIFPAPPCTAPARIIPSPCLLRRSLQVRTKR